ncbi:GNAT family N-acetyltransferase [Paenibacillus ginsengarvi]|uniref:GNAT family N-acetyltransferase n=1 Tax=Paenibacillus ginsengarvi TaxID=400777 RepID=A0A3B0BLM6_9BACL|nr:GNAT family N-acetyltransferase [Paenibacillus ginsengarvi]RKN72979.1 GNAT family N-acetyltransferase [Paenibacillus ginsengarvi]
MEVKLYDSARHFLDRTEQALEKQEAANNLLLGLAFTLAKQEADGYRGTLPMLGTVEDTTGRIELVFQLNALNMILAGDGPQLEEAVRLIVNHLVKAGRDVPGIVGPLEAAGQMASEWAKASGRTPYVKMNQRIYRLDRVNEVPISPGTLRLAGEADTELAAGWLYDFAQSIEEKMSREEAAVKMRDNIVAASLYVWEDGGRPVSMAKKSRPTRNGIVVTLVYTPPELRNKGYASSCVASLSRRLLEDGYRFCSLYTDLSNPTSNDIYAKIGYNPVQDSIMYRFR